MSKPERVLNLGAGNRPVKGAVNHDLRKHKPYISVVHDLNDIPWPWPDNSFDRIEAWSVFEHLKINLVEVMNECWRILAPGGKLHSKVPCWDVDTAWADPTHYWKYSLRSFDCLDPTTKIGGEDEFYTARKWKILTPAEKSSHSSFHIWLMPRKA